MVTLRNKSDVTPYSVPGMMGSIDPCSERRISAEAFERATKRKPFLALLTSGLLEVVGEQPPAPAAPPVEPEVADAPVEPAPPVELPEVPKDAAPAAPPAPMTLKRK